MTALTIRSSDPSTAKRVEEIARFIGDALQAANENLSPNSVTMVVSNWSMVVGLNPRDDEGAAAVQDLEQVATDARRAIDQGEKYKRIARAIGSLDLTLFPGGVEIVRPRCRRALLTITEESQLKALDELGREPSPSILLRGRTGVYSKIFRVGRSADGEPFKIRIEIKGQCRDICVEESQLDECYRISQMDLLAQIDLVTAWVGADKEIDIDQTYASRVRRWDPAPGLEFLKLARVAAPSLLNADLTDMFDDEDGGGR